MAATGIGPPVFIGDVTAGSGGMNCEVYSLLRFSLILLK